MLRDLADDGLVEKQRGRLNRPGALPAVAVLDDHRPRRRRRARSPSRPSGREDGEPAAADPHRRRRAAARSRRPGIGDRVLARLPPGEPAGRPTPRASSRCSERQPSAVLGVFRVAPDGAPHRAGRPQAEGADRRARRRRQGARTATWSRSTVTRCRPLRPRRAPRSREVLGSMTSEKAVSLIAIHAHGIPHVFPPDVLAEAEAAKPATHGRPRGLARRCRWSPSIRPTPRTMTTRSMPSPIPIPNNPGGFIVTVAIADVAAYVRPGTRARPRGAEARQFGLFPRPRRADAAGAHLQRSLLAARRRGPPGARRAHDLLRRRPQAQPPLPPRHDALGGEALLPAGAGGHRRPRPATRRPLSRRSSPASGPPTKR